MAKIRCFLCGGRVSGGVCTECGMPQRQHAQNYNLNESSCDDKPLTHVHDEYTSSSSGHTYANREHRKEKRSSYAKKEQRKERGNPAAKLIAAVIVVVVILVAMSIIVNVATSMIGIKGIIKNLTSFETEEVSFPEYIQNAFDDSHWEVDDSYYEIAMYELEETGDPGSTGLYAGYYVVGYDLPEGTYELEMLSGKGDISVDDSNNCIGIYQILDAEGQDGYATIGNLKLYNGAKVKLTGSAQVRLVTENAGPIIPSIENPLKDNPDVVIPGGEMYLAGVDFPAGTYDFYLEGNYDYVDIFTLTDDTAILEDGEEYSYEYESYIDCFFMKNPLFEESDWELDDYAPYVANVTIEEGTYVRISDPENVLYLTPSELVVPEEGVENGEYY